MVETYKKDDVREALRRAINHNDFTYLLSLNLVKVKIERLKEELKEAEHQYNRTYKPIIEENINKDPKDYTISQAMVKKINKNTTQREKLAKNINFYVKVATKIELGTIDDKRKSMLIKQIEKI